jgi:hypothetical protein
VLQQMQINAIGQVLDAAKEDFIQKAIVLKR